MSFESIFDSTFGSGRTASRPASPAPASEKGVLWEAKVIDGSYYVPLSQVAELLAANSVLPAVRKGIERRVQDQAEREGK